MLDFGVKAISLYGVIHLQKESEKKEWRCERHQFVLLIYPRVPTICTSIGYGSLLVARLIYRNIVILIAIQRSESSSIRMVDTPML